MTFFNDLKAFISNLLGFSVSMFELFLVFIVSSGLILYFAKKIIYDVGKWRVSKNYGEHKSKKEKPLNKDIGFKGFTPITSQRNRSTISLYDYLRDEHQKYYGWRRHQQVNPHEFKDELSYLNDESLLLKDLCSDRALPLLLIGEGGCGKTRLSLELARELNKSYKDWIAYKVPANIDIEALDVLIERAKLHKKKVLLLLDYVENLSGDTSFDYLYEIYMKGENATNLRWLLTCRSSYFDDIKNKPKHLTNIDLRVINLSNNNIAWLQSWQQATCLEIYPKEQMSSPILSVIRKYLTRNNRQIPHATGDDYQWVWHVLERSINDTYDKDKYSIAKLTMLFPIPKSAVKHLSDIEIKIIEMWCKDGWVCDSSDTNDAYALSHDVLCDFSVIHELRTVDNVKIALNDYWLYARQADLEKSYFIALQRILPIMALHFSLYALLLEDNLSQLEQVNKDHFAKSIEQGTIYVRVLTSFSFTFEDKKRVFNTDLQYYKVHELYSFLFSVNQKQNDIDTSEGLIDQTYYDALFGNFMVSIVLEFIEQEKIFNTNLSQTEITNFRKIIVSYMNEILELISKGKDDFFEIIMTSFPFSPFLRAYTAYLLFSDNKKSISQALNSVITDKQDLSDLTDAYYKLQEVIILEGKLKKEYWGKKILGSLYENKPLPPIEQFFKERDDLYENYRTQINKEILEKRIESYNTLIDIYKNINNKIVKLTRVKAMVNLGISYGQLTPAETTNEIDTYKAVIKDYQDSDNAEIQALRATAMVYLGISYGQLTPSEPMHAIDTYKAVIKDYQDSDNAEIQLQRAKAMVNLGISYGQLTPTEPMHAIDTYKAVINEYQDSANDEIQRLRAKAMVYLGISYGQLTPSEPMHAIDTYKTVIKDYQDSANDEIQLQRAKAMVNLGVSYGQLTPAETMNAIDTFNTLIGEYQDSDNDEIQRQILIAIQNNAELNLVSGFTDKAIKLAREAEKLSLKMDYNLHKIPIMYFIRYLADDGISISDILNKIKEYPASTGYDWGFNELQPFINSLDNKHCLRANSFIKFFSNEIDFKQLKTELETIG